MGGAAVLLPEYAITGCAMLRKIIVNSQTAGKFSERVINGRQHIATEMVSIATDSVMNRIFYPANAVRDSFAQLDRLPAPASHPLVDGLFISAKDPLAVNAHNVGAFALNPRLENGQVINELAIDIDVAEKDERGIEILRRIRAGERMGVSTGLNGSLVLVKGEHNGQAYDGVISNIEFDHVAVLLDEAPAGDATFTLNTSADDDVVVCNLDQTVNELREQLQAALSERFDNMTSAGESVYVYVVDVMLDPNSVIVEVNDKLQKVPFDFDHDGRPVLMGIGAHVKRVVTFEPNAAQKRPARNSQEDSEMNLELLVLAIIGNALNMFTLDDKTRLSAMSELDLMNAVHAGIVPPEVTLDIARGVCEADGLAVNTATDVEGLPDFIANRDAFTAFQATQADDRKAKADGIIANSDLTQADVDAMDDAALDRLSASIIPNQDYSPQGGLAPVRRVAGGDVVSVDFS